MSEAFRVALRQRRLDMEISQTDLAGIAQCDSTYVGLLERGARTPSRATVLALADALEMTTSQTDRLLFVAGYAPRVDYQMRWEQRHGPADDQQKWCPRCQSSLALHPAAPFYTDRSRHDGLDTICKACRSKVNKAKYNARVARRAS